MGGCVVADYLRSFHMTIVLNALEILMRSHGKPFEQLEAISVTHRNNTSLFSKLTKYKFRFCVVDTPYFSKDKYTENNHCNFKFIKRIDSSKTYK